MKTNLGLAVLAGAIALLLAPPLLRAKKVEFPEGDPAFTFTVPDNWTTEKDKDGRLYCSAPDGFKIGIGPSRIVSDADEAKSFLPALLKGMADAIKCEKYKADEAKTGQIDKLSVTSMQGQCKSEGIDMVLNALVFSLEPGKYFTIVGASPAILDKAHDKEMDDLIKSITAVD